MVIESIRNLVKDDLVAVNNLIKEKIESQINLVVELTNHIMQSGGKQLRPLIILLSCHACGYKGNEHITLAAMIEFFHTATLLHDDVIDESDLRRGRKTANKIWGTKASILVGDYLFTQHMHLMLEVGNLNIMHLLADTSHHIGIGEIKQLANRHNPSLSTSEYFDVIRSKTSLLFAASAKLGPLINNSDENIKIGLYNFGLHLGNAFQLIDDALDYCSDATTIGKNIGDDLADGKATLPLLYALQNGTLEQQNKIKHSLKKGSLEYLPEILETISKTNAIEYTKKIASEEVDKAISALQVLPQSVYKESLEKLAIYALERDH